MRLVHLDIEPSLSLALHPRLTVMAAQPDVRELLVAAITELLRGHASGLHGALVANGARAEFLVETITGPALPGAPIVVRATDLEAAVNAAAAQTPSARAQARHDQALEDLQNAETAAAEHTERIAGLERRRDDALRRVQQLSRGDTEPDECRRRLRTFVDELDAALRAPSLSDDRRVAMLERGTILAADASRLGVCQPGTVRALLDTLDALNPMPVGATSATPRLNGTHVPREVIADLEGVGKGGGPADPAHSELVVLETELREAVAQRAALDRAVASARSRALAVFAETESTRRANGDDVPGYAGALRARLTKRGATSWVGAAPVVLDDALASCPPDQVDDARAALLDASEHAQCIYITADAALLTWAAQLAPEAGVLAQPVPR